MASSDAILAHIISRVQADIDFLVAQGVISSVDGRFISNKLPSSSSSSRSLAPVMPTPAASPPYAAPYLSPPGPPVSPQVTPAPPSAKRVVPPPPPRPGSQLPQARALWAYNENGQEARDLSFSEGDIIEILEETNNDWWTGKNPRGQTGVFPANYVEKVAAPVVPSPLPGRGRMMAPIPNEKGSYDPMANAAQPPQPQEQQQAPKKSKFGKYGNTMAQSAAGGVGFGAGAAIGSGIVNAIF